MSNRISEHFDSGFHDKKITFGLDGFVDEVWQVLSQRISLADYKLFDKMYDFAKSVCDSGKGGYTTEVIRKRRSFGGFVSNTGNAAGRLDTNPTFVGMFGKEKIDPVFSKFAYNLVSISDPNSCLIFEFTDGKLMLPNIEAAMDFTWESLNAALPHEKLAQVMDADIVAIGYWCHFPDFDNIITGLCDNFLINGRCGRVFFDFADIRKSDSGSLERTFNTLAPLNEKIPMTLSVNEHEAGFLFSMMGRSFDWENPDEAEKNIQYVREKIGLDELIVHTPYFAAGSSAKEKTEIVMQRYCESPVITTGAGDNFNGGYLAASLGGTLTLSERLLVGNSTTSFYIRNGYSPDKNEMLDELRKYIS